MPGFTSGHTHVASGTPTRGIIEGGAPRRPLAHVVAALSDVDLDDLTAYNLAEILRSGCTTQLEMSQNLRQAESYVRVALKRGVRGYPGGMIPSTPRVDAIWARQDDQVLRDSVPDTLAEIDANLRFGAQHMNAGDGLIKPMMAAHATDTQAGPGARPSRTRRRSAPVSPSTWGSTPTPTTTSRTSRGRPTWRQKGCGVTTWGERPPAPGPTSPVST